MYRLYQANEKSTPKPPRVAPTPVVAITAAAAVDVIMEEETCGDDIPSGIPLQVNVIGDDCSEAISDMHDEVHFLDLFQWWPAMQPKISTNKNSTESKQEEGEGGVQTRTSSAAAAAARATAVSSSSNDLDGKAPRIKNAINNPFRQTRAIGRMPAAPITITVNRDDTSVSEMYVSEDEPDIFERKPAALPSLQDTSTDEEFQRELDEAFGNNRISNGHYKMPSVARAPEAPQSDPDGPHLASLSTPMTGREASLYPTGALNSLDQEQFISQEMSTDTCYSDGVGNNSSRAEFISATIIKPTRKTNLGLGLKVGKGGALEIAALEENGFLWVSGAPLHVGDRLVSLDTGKEHLTLTGHAGHMKKGEAIRLLRRTTGLITFVVRNMRGNPCRLECMTSKPHPDFGTGIFFASGRQSCRALHVHHIPDRGLFSYSLLKQGNPVISINGVSCMELDARCATDIVKSAPRYVSIVAEVAPQEVPPVEAGNIQTIDEEE